VLIAESARPFQIKKLSYNRSDRFSRDLPTQTNMVVSTGLIVVYNSRHENQRTAATPPEQVRSNVGGPLNQDKGRTIN
jgi:hypothetical protein